MQRAACANLRPSVMAKAGPPTWAALHLLDTLRKGRARRDISIVEVGKVSRDSAEVVLDICVENQPTQKTPATAHPKGVVSMEIRQTRANRPKRAPGSFKRFFAKLRCF